ncbi:hypothetical protein BC943DRAFT_328080 [Umbelopsis sp. AD052]|nr:hypothetical protein BC943DRAFT_328080 [Umbelopsis sp. AD052]
MSKMQSRKRQQGQAQTVSDGEEESRIENSSETTSRTRHSQADRPSSKNSDASGNNSDRASTEGTRTPTKSKSTPTRRSKSLTSHSARADQDASPKPTGRKQNVTSKTRSTTATKTSSENDPKSSPKQPVTNTFDFSDDSDQVIDYATLESAQPAVDQFKQSQSPPFRKYINNSRGRGNFRESPQFSTGHGRGRGSTRGGRQARRQFPDPTSNVQESVSVDNQDADVVKATSVEEKPVVDSQDARLPQDKPSFHRGAPRGRYRGDPSFRRGRGSWRGFHRGGSHPRVSNDPSSPHQWSSSSTSAVDTPVSPSSQVEKVSKVDADVEQLADSVSQTTLVTQSEDQVAAGDQPTGDTKDAADDQARRDAMREAKREKARKKRQAKRLSMKMANPSNSETPIPESSATKPQSDRPKKAHKTRPVSKSTNAKVRDEAVKNETNSATLEVSPVSDSAAGAEETVPAELSPAKVEGSDDKPKRQRKGKEQQQQHRSPAQNVEMAVHTPTDDSNQELSTTEYTHHKYKKNFARQEDNIRPPHHRNDVPVPMAHPMQPAVSTPSFVSQPVAFAITSPNGGPIPVYTMPFPPMNPAMGEGGRQGMFYAPMMGSPGGSVSTPSSANAPPMDPNNMMYMPYDSQQMMMYNPYWYQPVGMTQQGMPPPNPAWNADYNNNWKHPSERSQHEAPAYHPSHGVAYNNEHMSYPNDNNGPQAVYYYPVSY